MATQAAMPSTWPTIGEGISHSDAQLPPLRQTSDSDGTPVIVAPVANNNGNGWEFVTDDDEDDTHPPEDGDVVVVTRERRPRSKTMGGHGDVPVAEHKPPHRADTEPLTTRLTEDRKRSWATLRRSNSAPDLMGNEREVFILEEGETSEDSDRSSDDEKDDMEVVEREELDEDSFEVLDEADNGNHKKPEADEDDEEEPVMLDEDDAEYSMGESATLVSNFSMGSATLVSAPPSVASTWGGASTGGAWGSGPSFKDIVSKNAHQQVADKTHLESMLKDSHRKHRLRVRVKPMLVVQDTPKPKSLSLHSAHSTGDLMGLAEVEKERKHTFGKRGRRMGRDGMGFGALHEEEDDYGGGGGGGGFASPDPGDECQVVGDTDAMDYYHRKEKGSNSTVNKKKERPDEAKRREIIMNKKDMQRKLNAEREKSSGGADGAAAGGGGGKKKKNEKGFGGKKDRKKL